jgi:hypothetical protein
MKMTGFQCFQTYLALKNHFSSGCYDYFKYNGKTSVREDSFKMRKDRYFFEAMSRKRNDTEIREFFVSNFIASDDPSKLWIRSIVKDGEENFISWRKRNRNLTYNFSNEVDEIFEVGVDEALTCKKNSHPIILRKYLSGKVCIETLVILNKIFRFKKDYDKVLQDPIWESVSTKIEQYEPFVQVEIDKFVQIVKGKVT